MNLNKLFLLMLIGIVCSVSVVSAADVGEASVADNLDDVDFEAVHEDAPLKVYNKYSSISPDMRIAGFQDHSLPFGVDENNTDLDDSASEIENTLDDVYKVENTTPVIVDNIDLGNSTSEIPEDTDATGDNTGDDDLVIVWGGQNNYNPFLPPKNSYWKPNCNYTGHHSGAGAGSVGKVS